uniref:Membrane protein YjcL n=1 Tax=Auxenochlorella protothecoides TaxID=3075 RepID=A0A1D2AFB3_AUXPR
MISIPVALVCRGLSPGCCQQILVHEHRIPWAPAHGRLECWRPAHRHAPSRSQSTIPHSSASLHTLTVLTGCGAAGLSLEQVAPALSAPLLSIALAAVARTLGLLPDASPVYDAVWGLAMPMATALVLMEADMTRLFRAARDTLLAFLVASAATMLATLLAFALWQRCMGPHGASLASALCASYIGGSINFAATAAALQIPTGPALGAAMAADNVAMAGYIAALMAVPVPRRGRSLEVGAAGGPGLHGSSVLGDGTGPADVDVRHPGPASTPLSAASSLALAATACSLGVGASALLSTPHASLAATAVLTPALAAAARRLCGPRAFAGAGALGGALLALAFATIGGGVGDLRALTSAGPLLAFAASQLGLQLGITLLAATALRLPRRETLVAANAAVGGPGTAAAMAAARGWHDLVEPGVLAGTLGYAVGTAAGIAVSGVLRRGAALLA